MTTPPQPNPNASPDHIPAPAAGRFAWIEDLPPGSAPHPLETNFTDAVNGQPLASPIEASPPGTPDGQNQGSPLAEKAPMSFRAKTILAIGMAAAAAAGIVGAAFVRDPGSGESAHSREGVTAEAPGFSSNTTSIEAPATTRTTEKATTTVPASTTTSEAKPTTTQAPNTTVTAAETKPGAGPLTAAEIDRAVTASGLVELGNNKLTVLERVDSKFAHNTIIGLNGAKLSEKRITALKAQIAAAEAEALTHPTFAIDVQLGPDTSRSIGYVVAPSNEVSQKMEEHWFVVSGDDITHLGGKDMYLGDFPGEYTLNNPKAGMNVTVVKIQPDGANTDGFDLTTLNLGVGAWQTSFSIKTDKASIAMLDKELPNGLDTSNLPKLNGSEPNNYQQIKDFLTLVGREDFANGRNYAWGMARAGMPPYENLNAVPSFERAAAQIGAKTLGNAAYKPLSVHYPVPTRNQFNGWRTAA